MDEFHYPPDSNIPRFCFIDDPHDRAVEDTTRRLSTTALGRAFEEAFNHVYGANDEGHQADHFSAVESLGLEMNRVLGLGWDDDLITAVAWLHDMFAWSRHNHHELARVWVLTTNHPLMKRFTDQERLLIADACASHRASFKGEFPTTLSELMSAADRGHPGNLRQELVRGCTYSVAYLDMDAKDGMMRSVSHQQEKYGRDGYARYPQLYLDYFKDVMDARWEDIDALQTMSYPEVMAYINGELLNGR